MAKNRLSPEDWIAAGFQALSTKGPSALKAEPLARSLRTTKGSFYWHFADVPAFHAAMLELWEDRAFRDIATELDQIDSPVKRLRALSATASKQTPDRFGGIDAEPAIRAWSRESKAVAAAVARVDAQRLTYVQNILADIGLTNPDIARMYYGAYVGMTDLSTRDGENNTSALENLADLILALYEEA